MKAYRKLSDTSYRLMRKEAVAFAEVRGEAGLMTSSRDESERHFVLQASGDQVTLVGNSSMQLVVMVVGDSGERVPALRELQQKWWVRARPDWNRWRSLRAGSVVWEGTLDAFLIHRH